MRYLNDAFRRSPEWPVMLHYDICGWWKTNPDLVTQHCATQMPNNGTRQLLNYELGELLPQLPLYHWQPEVVDIALNGWEAWEGLELTEEMLRTLPDQMCIPAFPLSPVLGGAHGFYPFPVSLLAFILWRLGAPSDLRRGGLAVTSVYAPTLEAPDAPGPLDPCPPLIHHCRLLLGQPVPHQIAQLLALSAFARLPFVSAEEVMLSRPQRRRYQKKGHALPLLRTVRLRRPEPRSDAAEPSAREWSCQWFVRGHWRQQYCGPHRARRPVYVQPHLKGPDGLPVRPPRQTLYQVRQ